MRSEYVLAIEGKVVKRAPENVNPKIATGEIEIYANTLKILSKSETPPFPIEDRSNVSEAIRLKYRYLDLRRPSMQKNLMTRFKITKVVRDFLNKNGFIEIETPLLIKSTPEGSKRLPCAKQNLSGQILCFTSISSNIQTTSYDFWI